MIEGVLWDWTKTLCPSPLELDYEIAEARHSAIRAKLGEEGIRRYKELKSVYPTDHERFTALGLSGRDLESAIRGVDKTKYLKDEPQVREALRRLGNYRHAILTNQPLDMLLSEMELIGLPLGYFASLITTDRVPKAKPFPEPFLKALEELGIVREEAVMIGDRFEVDILPAKQLGFGATVLIGSKEEGADYYIDNVYEAPDLPIFKRRVA